MYGQAFEEAVVRGDIYWHAFPFNAQLEMYDEDLLTFNVKMTHDLDTKFNLTPKITLSQAKFPSTHICVFDTLQSSLSITLPQPAL